MNKKSVLMGRGRAGATPLETLKYVPPPLGRVLPRKEVRRLVREALLAPGQTVPEIAASRRSGRLPAGDPAQEGHAGRRVWHTKKSIDKRVAAGLKLRRSAWDDSRTNNDLQDATARELQRLRKAGKLDDWGRRVSIYRLADGHGLEAQPPTPMSANERPPEPPEARWRGSGGTDEDRMAMFMWILRHGAKDNTYKFAMARALIEVCHKNADGRGPLTVEYKELAEMFLKYYWRQVHVFHIRQHHHPKKEAEVAKAIRDMWGPRMDGKGGGGARGRRPTLDFGKVNKCEKECVSERILCTVFGSERSKKGIVVPRFQKVRIGKSWEVAKKFYDYDDQKKAITINEDSRRFFAKNHAILHDEVTFVWAKYLDGANGGLPGLLAKVEAARTRPLRNAACMKAAREMFLGGGEECFYCGCRLDRKTIQVDHFIPWSFIFDDQLWNLVPSCSCCNGRKSNLLPDADAYGMLVERNERHAGRAGRISDSLGLLGRGGDWKREMQIRYDTCKDYRFGTVSIGDLCEGQRGVPCRGRMR